MIGDRYWSLGIRINPHSQKDGEWRWTVRLEFYDDGFAQDGSTEGTLTVRYVTTDLDAAIDLLKADAEKLGIRWVSAERGVPLHPNVALSGNEEDPKLEWVKSIADAQSERLGWTSIYKSLAEGS
jgi:hypothetical protein